jgi:hypothetical protein
MNMPNRVAVRLLVALLPWVIALAGAGVAHADIYTWTDAKGTVNISNVPPPDDVHVTTVMHEDPTALAARAAAAQAARDAEMQRLADRVRQLEYDAQYGPRQAPPVVYAPSAPAPAPSVVQYVMNVAPPQSQSYGQNGSYGCDPGYGYDGFDGYGYGYANCGGLGYSGFYPYPVYFVGAPFFRNRTPFRGDHRPGMQRPTPHAPSRMH